MPPARMRVLVGVRQPRVCVTTFADVDARGASTSSSRRPGSSSPATPTAMALPPSAATLFAALPAPPGTISVESYSRIRTGASRDTRAICAVDELVDEQIAEHRDADAGEVVDERQQAIAGDVAVAPSCLPQDPRRRGDQVVGDRRPARRRRRRRRLARSAVAGAHEDAPARRPPAPACTSVHLSPTTNERDRSRSRSAAAARSMPGRGLRQSQSCR